MRHKHISFPVMDPFRAVRQDFERRMTGTPVDLSGLRVTETETEVSVSLDLPGVSEDAVDITIEKGILTIAADRQAITPPDARVLFRNTSQGAIQRTLKLHDSIDPESVDAVMEHGVLTITMSRQPEPQPCKVTVRAAS